MMRVLLASGLVLLSFTSINGFALESSCKKSLISSGGETEPQWKKLATVPFKGKQDDIFFINPDLGWYVNGQGFIYKTTDGGVNWKESLHKPGTYFRAIGFVDENNGFAGNIGPGSFPDVTDTTPLYQTKDGGATWVAVKDVSDKAITGVCAIDILKTKFINAGKLDTRITIRAAGRVGGPASMVTSRDGGGTWETQDLSSQAGMILDVKFLDERVGFVFAASHYDVAEAHAKILKTTDGGKTWKSVYESKRPFETTWKGSFPTKQTGFATIQSYNPDESVNERFVVKTEDGGDHWTEIPLVKDAKAMEFGVGFIDEKTGWVGVMDGGYMTTDGGKTWTHQDMGRAVNKIRVISSEQGPVVYAIGVDVRKIDLRKK